MDSSPRSLLLGPERGRFQRRLDALSAILLGVLTFLAYAIGVFEVSSGVLVVPGDATLVSLVAAGGVGYRRGGVAVAWLVAVAPQLGFRADWAFFGLSSRSLGGQLAFLFDPVSLAVSAVIALVFGTLGFGVGALARWTTALLRRRAHSPPE